MNALISAAKNNKFLPATNHFVSPRFYDSEELFAENLKTQPTDWYYRTNPVNYTLNSSGYRAAEFDTINWSDSVVMFGCSQLFGVGVDDKDTLPSQLSSLIGKTVVNMGVIGSSMMFAFHNSLILKNICSKPLAVVNMWTNCDRTIFYGNPMQHCGAWNYDSLPYAKAWMEDLNHSDTHAYFISSASKHLWHDTKYYEFSLFEETTKVTGCDLPALVGYDYARDLSHQGRNTYKILAYKIANKLF